MYRLWDRGASKMMKVGIEPILYPRKSPTCEERCHRIAQPFAESDVTSPGARLRNFPSNRLWQSSDWASLEEKQFIAYKCPLNVLWNPTEMRFDAPGEHRYSKRLFRIDCPLPYNPACCLLAPDNPFIWGHLVGV